MQPKQVPAYEEFFNGYAIMANQHVTINPKIMGAIYSRIVYCANIYGRCLVVPFGLNYPVGYEAPADNRHIIRFLDLFIKYMNRNNLTTHYVWVREQHNSNNQHYHCIFILDGNRIYYTNKIMKEATRLWSNAIGANNSVYHNWEHWRINASNMAYDPTFADCIYALSYYAKNNSKYMAPARTRNFDASRLPVTVEHYNQCNTLPSYEHVNHTCLWQC